MPDLNLALAILTGAAAIIGAIGGLSGLAALYSAKNAARKTDVDALNVTILTLQTENARLVARVDALETELVRIREQASSYQDWADRLEEENRHLRGRIEGLVGEPVEIAK